MDIDDIHVATVPVAGYWMHFVYDATETEPAGLCTRDAVIAFAVFRSNRRDGKSYYLWTQPVTPSQELDEYTQEYILEHPDGTFEIPGFECFKTKNDVLTWIAGSHHNVKPEKEKVA
jgi:hypothetical protein